MSDDNYDRYPSIYMRLPDGDFALVYRWVDALNTKVPARLVDEVGYEMDAEAGTITILECRPPWNPANGLWVDPVPGCPTALHQDAQ